MLIHFISMAGLRPTRNCHFFSIGSPSSKDTFHDSLEQTRHRYKFEVIGYVVMPEHVHLPSANLPEPTLGGIKPRRRWGTQI